jgi:hypothetical protein
MLRIPTLIATGVLLSAALPVAARAADPAMPPIPELDRWQAQMIEYGEQHCRTLGDPAASADTKLASTYYDAERVYLQIAAYTGDTSWNPCAALAERAYRDAYVSPNGGVVPGYWNFSTGMRIDFERTGDRRSRDAVVLLSEGAAFARDGTPLEWTEGHETSREVAYAILSYLDAEDLGEARRTRRDALVRQAIGHVDQWFGSRTATYVQPFMVGLTLEALIRVYEREPRLEILNAVRIATDALWEEAWIPEQESFFYISTDPTAGAPDLNLLIAPAYAWMWSLTHDPRALDRADQVFAGGVRRAWLGGAKHYNQSYRWSFDYVGWRSLPALAPVALP